MDPTTKFDQKQGYHWEPDFLKEYLDARLEELDRRLGSLMDERDRRYEQRFEAQQDALQTALVAQEKAVLAALSAADRAVTKAEEASEKRFDSVNEFRATLADQASAFMPRNEAEARIATNADKVDALTRVVSGCITREETLALARSNAEKIDTLQTRLDRSEGNRGGVSSSGQLLFAVVIGMTALVSVAVAIITLATRH